MRNLALGVPSTKTYLTKLKNLKLPCIDHPEKEFFRFGYNKPSLLDHSSISDNSRTDHLVLSRSEFNFLISKNPKFCLQ